LDLRRQRAVLELERRPALVALDAVVSAARRRSPSKRRWHQALGVRQAAQQPQQRDRNVATAAPTINIFEK
jgi:hypothetical protein